MTSLLHVKEDGRIICMVQGSSSCCKFSKCTNLPGTTNKMCVECIPFHQGITRLTGYFQRVHICTGQGGDSEAADPLPQTLRLDRVEQLRLATDTRPKCISSGTQIFWQNKMVS
jgi:hypothetical protein